MMTERPKRIPIRPGRTTMSDLIMRKAVTRNFVQMISMMMLLFTTAVGAVEPPKVENLPTARGPWKTRINVQWSGTPLRESLNRLSASHSFRYLLDRRIDPSLRLAFEAKNEPLETALPRLAAEHGLGCCVLTGTIYFGTEDAATLLPGLLENRRKRITELPPGPRRFFRENIAVTSPLLGTPKEILTALARHGRMSWQNLDELPHDLWNETRLSGSGEELLPILLLGFDRTFDFDKTGTKLIVTTIPEDIQRETETTVKKSIPTRDDKTKTEKIPLARRRFTIRVEEQPLDELLRSLSDRLGLTLKLDEKSLTEKNVTLDRRVSFDVKNATVAELFRAVLQPLRLQFRLRGDTIEVF